jgi:hypothetical protein
MLSFFTYKGSCFLAKLYLLILLSWPDISGIFILMGETLKELTAGV